MITTFLNDFYKKAAEAPDIIEGAMVGFETLHKVPTSLEEMDLLISAHNTIAGAKIATVVNLKNYPTMLNKAPHYVGSEDFYI